jgi:hypothetical protein
MLKNSGERCNVESLVIGYLDTTEALREVFNHVTLFNITRTLSLKPKQLVVDK